MELINDGIAVGHKCINGRCIVLLDAVGSRKCGIVDRSMIQYIIDTRFPVIFQVSPPGSDS